MSDTVAPDELKKMQDAEAARKPGVPEAFADPGAQPCEAERRGRQDRHGHRRPELGLEPARRDGGHGRGRHDAGAGHRRRDADVSRDPAAVGSRDTIAAGKSADFVVLDANPLDDITNTRTHRPASTSAASAVDRAALKAGWTGRGIALRSAATAGGIERRARTAPRDVLCQSVLARPLRSRVPRARLPSREVSMDEHQLSINRRRFIECFSARRSRIGADARRPRGRRARRRRRSRSRCCRSAQQIAGVSFTADEQQQPSRQAERRARLRRGIRAAASREPRRHAAGDRLQSGPSREETPDRAAPLRRQPIDVSMPGSDEELAFLPLTHLATARREAARSNPASSRSSISRA